MTDNRELAEKIAGLVHEDGKRGLAAIYASIEKINQRLDRLEVAASEKPATLLPPHPSREKFSIAEAIVDELFAAGTKEKACTFEPNARPCDHCSMCSSRGF